MSNLIFISAAIVAVLYADRMRMVNWSEYRPLVVVGNLLHFALCCWVLKRVMEGGFTVEGSLLCIGVCASNFVNSLPTWRHGPPKSALKHHGVKA
jgi:hypothetical protein